ncbi:MAG: class I SAM-dependent methyltransferase [Chitinivibrionales bacterium]
MISVKTTERSLGILENKNSGKVTASFLNTYASPKPITLCPSLRVHQADDIFALWEAWENRIGEISPPPFWAVVWPAAAVSCAYISENPSLVRGKTVLDCGCGGGSVAIAASRCGAARTIANDIDPVALRVAAYNASLNDVSLEMVDADLTQACTGIRFDIVFAADMFYEKGPSRRMMQWFEKMRMDGTRIIVSDGGRNFAPETGFYCLQSREVAVDSRTEGSSRRIVRLLAMK